MTFDNFLDIIHATVADFHVVFVEDFMELVVRWEVLPDQRYENFADIGSYIFTKGWVKPNYLPPSFSATRLLTSHVVRDRFAESALLQGIFIETF